MKRDAAIAVALFAAAAIELRLRDEPELALQLGATAPLCAGLLLRTSSLWLMLLAQLAGFLVLAAASAEPEAVAAIPPLLIALFAVGSSMPSRQSILALAGMSVAVFVNSMLEQNLGDALYVTGVFVVPPWVGGRLIGTRRRQVEELERLYTELAEERARAEQLSAEAERARIAREMHDVLSHGMSLMVLQAGAGPRLKPAEAREAFRSIQRTGERAREELQAALTGREEVDLDTLVGDVPGARLQADGDLSSVAPGVRLAVQRIVQEALTNAVKHGSGGALVTVRCDGSTVELSVRDPGGAGTGISGSGRGLIGMRERAAAYGGTLETGPSDDGGYEVRARLPAHPR